MDRIKTKYIMSVIIDIIIVELLVFNFLIKPIIVIPPILERFLPFLFLVFHLIQDKLFLGRSIGKRIFGIKLTNGDNQSDKVNLQQVVIRRILEIIYTARIFIWRLHIDISTISNTTIVSKSEKLSTSIKIPRDNSMRDAKNITMQRVYALLIDLAIISWAFILYYLIGIPSIKNSMSNNVFIFIRFTLNIIIIIYMLFKDFVYKNRSIGKLKQNIEILDQKNNKPSNIQILLRNGIGLVFFPIELILLFAGYKLICDRIAFTQISIVKP